MPLVIVAVVVSYVASARLTPRCRRLPRRASPDGRPPMRDAPRPRSCENRHDDDDAYGEKAVWARRGPASGRSAPRLVVLATLALLVAAWIVPGAAVESFGGAFVAAAVIAVLNAIVPPVIAALRLPLMLVLGLLLVLVAGRADAARRRRHHGRRPLGRLVLVGARRRARRLGGVGRARRGLRHERRRRLHAARDPADREALRRARRDRRAGDHLPRDRRARAARAAAGDARRQRAQHGPLARRGRLHADRVGDRPLLADGRLPGGDPARLERGHPRLPLGREGDGDGDDVLGAPGLRRDRASPCGHGLLRDGGASRGNLLSGEADH